MKAKITAEIYRCAPKGSITETYYKDEIVTGKAAEMAVEDKAAKVVKESEPKKPELKPKEKKPAEPKETK